ncbi:putative ribonuclease H-like domain-containing protein [Tanacetum coccineum]|uniref:Ribonuclease H-like domain-containing protein n=1 Tax=Tanacetum coccineum TaxID=301880 RepID=A0ABQ5DPG2_9ASTR
MIQKYLHLRIFIKIPLMVSSLLHLMMMRVQVVLTSQTWITVVNVSPIPTSRIHYFHLSKHSRRINSAVQTRDKDSFKYCLFACFLFQHETQEDFRSLLKMKVGLMPMQRRIVAVLIQKVRGLSDLPYGNSKRKGLKTLIEVFAPVAILEAIRIFLALPHIWGFIAPRAEGPQHDIILVQVYVDDIIFGSTKKSWCDEFEALMKSRFQMSSMGELTFFLGLQVKQKPDGIFISQDKYVAEILKKFDFANWSMIGSLMYLTASRPDIMFAVCACSRFQVTPKSSHLSVVKRIFRAILTGNPQQESINMLLLHAALSELNPVYHSKTKHIAIRHHFIRDAYEKKLIQVLKIHTDDNVADLLTKAFDVSRMEGDSSERPSESITYTLLCSTSEHPHEATNLIISCHISERLLSEGRERDIRDEDKGDCERKCTCMKMYLVSTRIKVSMTKEKVSTDRTNSCTEALKVSMISDIEGMMNKLKIDPKTKEGEKKKIEEEDESESESDGIPEAEKKFKQLESDEEMARKIQEEWEGEEERNRIAEEKAANEALIRNFDDIKARIEADRLLAEKLQEQEREQFTIEERAKFLHDTIAAQRRFLAQQRSEAIKNRPPTKNQLRNQMMTYLKHVGNFKHAELKIKKFEEVQALYEKIKRSDEDFISIGSAEDERLIKRMNEKGVDSSKSEVLKEESKEEVQKESKEEESTRKRKLGTRKKMKSRKRRYIQNTSEDDSDKENDELRLHLTIAPDEEKEVDYEILDRKYPIKEWKTECLGTKPQTDQAEHIEEINQNVVIRSNGQKRYFSTLMRVLSIFDREDLNAVYQLVMDRFQDEIPEGFDRVLWGDLMVMFNPDDESEFWSSQQDWKIVSWKLHGSSGVHTLVTETGLVIHMLVEKKYPLRKEVLMQMLKLKLESEEDSTMALELIRFIKKILAELEPEE